MNFPTLVSREIEAARAKHPQPIHSRHEGYAVILEEVRELEAEVFVRRPAAIHLLSELVQVAAMCQRMAEDLRLGPDAQA